MGQVQLPCGILLHTEVQCLHALLSLAISTVLQELQTRASEPLLLLEDGLVADGDLDGRVISGVEARLRHIGELEDAAPLQVVALDIVWVVDGVGSICVELGRVCSPRGRDTAIEDDGALDVCASIEGRCSEGAARNERDGGKRSEHVCLFTRRILEISTTTGSENLLRFLARVSEVHDRPLVSRPSFVFISLFPR